MFTGIITAIGTIERAEATPGGAVLRIVSPYSGLVLGESIAVDGACLTVERIEEGSFGVTVIPTSLERTGFGHYVAGRKVNLERALAVGDRLGGHLVSGHVDAVGRVTKVRDSEQGRRVEFTLPDELSPVTIPLGSITVNGVSLTVNALPSPDVCEVSLIPHTLQVTTLGSLAVGEAVHLEGDMVGKYVKQLLTPWKG